MPRLSLLARFYSSLGLAPSARPKQSRVRGSRLRVEALETRALLTINAGVLIQGVAFADALDNGQPAGQPTFAGVTVDLYKDGGNGVFDGGQGAGSDDTLVGTPVITDVTGHFSFPVTSTGTYFVKEIAPSGFVAPNPITVNVTPTDLAGVDPTTIDRFTTPQNITADPTNPAAGATMAAPEAIGGQRDISVQLTSTAGEVLLEANPSYDPSGSHLLHFDTLGNDGVGEYTVAWDGSNSGTPPALNYTGLGGVNLSTGSATGIALSMGADHEGSTATVTIFKDANDWSTATVAIPGPSEGISSTNPNEKVFIPFSSFTTGGGTGAGNFSSVGAIQMQITGSVPGLNGQISAVTTTAPTIVTENLANTPQADLQITKTDGKTSAIPGTSDTYTIVVTNGGPSGVSGASIVDDYPSNFTNVTYTATATGGATGFTANGSGNLDDTAVNMPAGSTITYLVTGTIGSSATGSLTNTTTVTAPAGIDDPTPVNNTSTDVDTLTPQADLEISKTDGKTSAIPGTSDTYTIVVTNAGPSSVSGASVFDNYPSNFTGVTFTATATGGASGFTANGSGNLDDTNVNLPVGSTITYTVTGTISPSASGSLSNTATVSAPGSVTDPTPANNSATDTDTLTPQADLQITKTDGKTTVDAGSSDTYTILVTNTGPSAVSGASIVDDYPTGFVGVTYTATATGGASGFTASGSGNLDDTNVNLPVGSTITYTVTGTISATASGTLSNSATASVPEGANDPTPINNTATDTDTVIPEADLQITKTDGKTTAIPGTTDTYTIVVTNAGPSPVTGASVVDTYPSNFTNVTYTASATGGATGYTMNGSGNLDDTNVTMPVGSTITYLVTGTINASASGTLSNLATVTVPSGVNDPTPVNNSATDTDTLTPQADLQITKTDGKTAVVAGSSDTYTIVVTNAGPGAVSGATVTDVEPSTFTNVTYTASGTGGASGFTASGSGNINDTNVNLPVGATITYIVTGTVSSSASGTISNTATVSVPTGVTDPSPDDDTATDTDFVAPPPITQSIPPTPPSTPAKPPLSKALFLGRY